MCHQIQAPKAKTEQFKFRQHFLFFILFSQEKVFGFCLFVVCFSYLSDSDFATGEQKVFHVSSTLGHVEFGLRAQSKKSTLGLPIGKHGKNFSPDDVKLE